MKNKFDTLTVETGVKSKKKYPIYIGKAILNLLDKVIPRNVSVLIVIDSRIARLHRDKITRLIEFLTESRTVNQIIIPGEEDSKSLSVSESLYEKAASLNLDRSSWFIGIGGGVVGDLTGFVAATYMRGANLLHVPTTLLAQVDSSVGGKVAINQSGYKNLVGNFYQPKAVIIDTNFLDTLPIRELRAGLAEVFKYGILCDRELFLTVKSLFEDCEPLNNVSWERYSYLIHKSCEIKADIVSQDEIDTGIRMLLNLGHTFAHALEGATSYNYFKHGEAVMWGLAMSAELSYKLNKLTYKDYQAIAELPELTKVPEVPIQVKDPNIIEELLLRDKKKTGEELTVILPTSIGSAEICKCPATALIKVILES
ncbi:3-dehydroquinate synthase [Natranaerobius thermophilus]|uniref:3-dehydroquinate synthase n=1 Tax=Natranaerobius thermophilus (strain ATCC BAA-1301 / DSM 18059 / JW/NM-WN-LF) TaxID=457570 RepID=AROB_NATTJ|nr:3-dehydroquinate synthase [Natranaerobius thermophilus]B2A259.1 RecName: Full=3-dehydroquinate synthase; Short=DHQS [Natranaerobius thermophilus JW/NM-WN-LF]ACB84864.1 3-dehydroquinate synthase [Natranaerobius thermophilus JW/NM-WN-LF]